jgi:GPH family glycoside/pentoside/hexuronide:cation symporter
MSTIREEIAATLAADPREEGRRAARMPLSVVIDYVAPTIGIGFMFLLVNLYLMSFATDVLLIAPAAMGTIFGVSRLWDAVSDPVAGYWSDRTNTRFGRRRPWLIAAILPVGIAYTLLWSPPAALSGGALIAWTALGVFGFYSAMTIFIVPHTALGAELTDDTHDRTRIFAFRHVGWTLGSLLAVGGLYRLTTIDDPRGGAFTLAVTVAVVTGLSLIWAAVRLRERPEYQGRGATSPLAASKDVWANPHARLLLVVYLIENLGGATIAILTPYVGKYVLHTPEQTSFYILVYMVASLVFVPIWLPLGRRFGKKRLWVASMMLTSFAFGGMFFLSEGTVTLIYVMAGLAGFSSGCGAMMAPSIQADVIDYDEYLTGQRKEGAYFAAWNFVFKTATGVTLMLTGFVLQFAGFVPNEVQSESAEFAIRALYSLFPLACYGIGTLIFLRFKLDEKEHARIRKILDERAAAGATAR